MIYTINSFDEENVKRQSFDKKIVFFCWLWYNDFIEDEISDINSLRNLRYTFGAIYPTDAICPFGTRIRNLIRVCEYQGSPKYRNL